MTSDNDSGQTGSRLRGERGDDRHHPPPLRASSHRPRTSAPGGASRTARARGLEHPPIGRYLGCGGSSRSCPALSSSAMHNQHDLLLRLDQKRLERASLQAPYWRTLLRRKAAKLPTGEPP
jgi:hypothetical protein